MQEADGGVFAELDAWTAPRFCEVTPGIGIGCDRKGPSSRRLDVLLWQKRDGAGIYDYTILSATGTLALVKWLSDHEFHIPDGSEQVFRRYVDRGWCWLAIRLNSQRFDKGIVAPHPIRYAYRDKQCVYPLIISRLSADDENEIVLYIVSRQPYGCKNWANRPIPREQVKRDQRSANGTDYDTVFRLLTDQANGHLFVPEYVVKFTDFNPFKNRYFAELADRESKRSPNDESHSFYLTRLCAIVGREAMDRDVILVPRNYADEFGHAFGTSNSVFQFVVEDAEAQVARWRRLHCWRLCCLVRAISLVVA